MVLVFGCAGSTRRWRSPEAEGLHPGGGTINTLMWFKKKKAAAGGA
jgi:hypothetical protein